MTTYDQKTIEDILKRLSAVESNSGTLPYHTHTGIDMNKVQFVDVDTKKFYIQHTIQGTAAAARGPTRAPARGLEAGRSNLQLLTPIAARERVRRDHGVTRVRQACAETGSSSRNLGARART